MLTDFQNSFAGRLTGKFATNLYSTTPLPLSLPAKVVVIPIHNYCVFNFMNDFVAQLSVSVVTDVPTLYMEDEYFQDKLAKY